MGFLTCYESMTLDWGKKILLAVRSGALSQYHLYKQKKTSQFHQTVLRATMNRKESRITEAKTFAYKYISKNTKSSPTWLEKVRKKNLMMSTLDVYSLFDVWINTK